MRVMPGQVRHMENHLLGALPAATYRRLLPHLEPRTLTVDQRLFPRSGPLQFGFFPIDSIVTLSYAIGDDAMAKAWPVGREGMVGMSLLSGSAHRDGQAHVLFGGLAYRISAVALRSEFRRAGALQRLLLRYLFASLTQASQLGVCNLYHSADQRLCRFLSLGFARVGGKDLFITHARMARLLGLRREAITEIAMELHQAGIIRYCRGHITLMNSKSLNERACVCNRVIRRAFEAVIGGS
jgi:hypothetical protein